MPWVKVEPEKDYLDHREEGCEDAAKRLRALSRIVMIDAGFALRCEESVDIKLAMTVVHLLGRAALYADVEEARARFERLDFYKRRRGCIPMYADDPVEGES